MLLFKDAVRGTLTHTRIENGRLRARKRPGARMKTAACAHLIRPAVKNHPPAKPVDCPMQKLAAANLWLRENMPQVEPPQPKQPVTESTRRRIKKYENE